MPTDLELNTLRLVEEARTSNPWPSPFFADGRGVWWQDGAPDEDGKSKLVWISERFDVVAETTDEAGEWGLLLRWRDRDGQPRDRVVPRRLLHSDGNQIAADLEAGGLSVGTGKRIHDLLKELLSRAKAADRCRCVRRVGWHRTADGDVYVYPSGISFGPGSRHLIFLTDHASKQNWASGTLAEWQEHVARLAIGNPWLGLFLAAAFAAPLLQIVGGASGGIHVHGQSQSGKTTCLKVAVSAWGLPTTRGYLRTWRTTDNGMEGIASETCDALLALDELAMVDARVAGQIVYSLANEAGKSRAGRDGAGLPRRSWRSLFLSTGEIPLAAKMGEKGGSPMAGQEVRMADLTADAGAGLGVFRDLHGFGTGAAFSKHLTAATLKYYGTAAPAFVEGLADHRTGDLDGLLEIIRKETAAFDETVNLPLGADGQVRSVAARFGLIAAAGELATLYGVLPWPPGEARTAAAAGFHAWVVERGGVGAGEDRQAIATVRRFLEAHADSRFKRIVPGDKNTTGVEQGAVEGVVVDGIVVNRVGYRRQTNDGTEFLIFREQWKSEVCKGLDPGRAAHVLAEAGFLDRGEGNRMAKNHRIPGEGTVRLYTVSGRILQATE